MGLYRKKPVVIEAVQWFKDGDHPEVESRAPKIIFDRAGNYFYVARYDNALLAQGWLAVEPDSEIARANGAYLPFAFYEVKSGDQCPVTDRPDLLARYSEQQKWTDAPAAMGYVKTLEGGHFVTPGDWIIRGVKGELYPCKPDIFAATYEPYEGC
jgi:hypothetical protein